MNEIVSAKMRIERNGEIDVIDIDGYINYTVDNRYGEDADGNRGSSRIEVEDIDEVGAYNMEGEEIKLTDAEYEIACEILTTKFLEG